MVLYVKRYPSGRSKVSCGLIWLEQSSHGYHRGPDGPVLISCGAEYNAHAADTIQPTPAETLVLMMMIFFGSRGRGFSKYGISKRMQGSSEAI